MAKTYSPFGWVDLETGCPETHALKVYNEATPEGAWITGTNTSFGMLQQGNGCVKFRGHCRACGAESGDIPKLVIKAWHLRYQISLDWARASTPNTYPACGHQECEQPGIHQHHYAPSNTFGLDANNWPIGPLCQEHHTFWHARMDTYVRCAKGIAS